MTESCILNSAAIQFTLKRLQESIRKSGCYSLIYIATVINVQLIINLYTAKTGLKTLGYVCACLLTNGLLQYVQH